MVADRMIDLNGRGDRIRTYDLLVPNQALYQAKLHPVTSGHGRLPFPSCQRFSYILRHYRSGMALSPDKRQQLAHYGVDLYFTNLNRWYKEST